MTFGTVAIIAGVTAAAGVAGSAIASHEQAAAQNRAAQTQRGTFNKINAQEMPYIQSGYGAQNALNDLLGTGNKDLTGPDGNPLPGGDFGKTSGLGSGYLTHQFNQQDLLNNLDPGYQFQLQTGGQAIRNADTPGVGALSGPALKDLMSFNQGLASTSYQNAFNRYTTQQNNIFGRLSQIAGLGQNAATQVGNQGAALGTGIAQAQAQSGASTAAGIVGATNSISNSGNLLSYLKGMEAS